MKYGILMRNVIFLVDKRTTKTINPVNIAEAHTPPPPPCAVFHFDVCVKPCSFLREDSSVWERNISQHLFMTAIVFHT